MEYAEGRFTNLQCLLYWVVMHEHIFCGVPYLLMMVWWFVLCIVRDIYGVGEVQICMFLGFPTILWYFVKCMFLVQTFDVCGLCYFVMSVCYTGEVWTNLWCLWGGVLTCDVCKYKGGWAFWRGRTRGNKKSMPNKLLCPGMAANVIMNVLAMLCQCRISQCVFGLWWPLSVISMWGVLWLTACD